MFKKAAQLKLRFDTPKGQVTVEDLFDLPLTSTTGRVNLNDIAKGLHKALKDETDVDFVDTAKRGNPTLQLKFDIVRDVITTRIAERDAEATRQKNAEQRQKIMSIIEMKQGEAMSAKSIEELQSELAKLAA